MATKTRQRAGLAARNKRFEARIEWFDKQMVAKINLTLRQRVLIVGQLIRDKVVINLSKPVTKTTSKRTGKVVVPPESRSKAGEFPKADTTRLMKSITYSQVGLEGRIGTNLDYGLLHELRDRPFLSRTLKQMRRTIVKIITQRIVP